MGPTLRPIHVRLDGSPRSRGDASCWELGPDVRPPASLLICDSLTRVTRLHSVRGIEREWADPLEALRWLERASRKPTWADERWVGFVSYDVGRLFEELPVRAEADLGL